MDTSVDFLDVVDAEPVMSFSFDECHKFSLCHYTIIIGNFN